MISHTTFGTNDLARAEAFFDGLLPMLNGKKHVKTDRAVFYAFGDGAAKLAISQPFNGEPASVGNGTMLAFTVPSIDAVHDVYSKALALGAKDEGEPGPRYNGLYYGAYFRDLDGNKFTVFHLLQKPDAIDGE